MMNTFSMLFLIAVGAGLALQVWLARRQIACVRSHAAEVPAAFADKVSLEAHQKAALYTVTKNRLGIVEAIIGTALLLLWTLGGGLDLLDRSWRGTGFGAIGTGIAFLVSLGIINAVLELPLSIYNTFVVEQRFGFNKMTPRLFVVDMLKGLLVSLIIGVPLLAVVLWLMQGAGELWWLYAWLLWSGFSLFMVWAYPTFIAPMFNKFQPLDDADLMQRLEALLDRTGFRSRGVFVMDGSRRSTHGNAYFTGMGQNKRIVFFDTLLKSLLPEEIEAVLAHELGHFRLNHIKKRIAMTFALSLAGLALLGWLVQQPWFFTGLGASQSSNYMALALFFMVGPVFTLFLSPVFSWGSRKHEFEADAFAAEQADANKLVSALVKMYEENAKTLTPDPLHSVFYDSHPPAPVRIAHLQTRS